MSDSEIPFLAQAAVLERLAHSPHPDQDPEALAVVLIVLHNRTDLRRHFFRCHPHPAWAAVLWEHGFFDAPPSPQKTEGGYVFPRWEVQDYLAAVAPQVSEIVIKHVETIKGHGWYLAGAIRALCCVAPPVAQGVVHRVLEWLQDPSVAATIVEYSHELMLALARGNCTDAALDLFRALCRPVRRSQYQLLPVGTRTGDPMAILYETALGTKARTGAALQLLQALDAQAVVLALEEHLRTALRMEADLLDSPQFEFAAAWRNAIEDTDQDIFGSAKDQLLRALRNALEAWVEQSPAEAEHVVRRYLTDEHRILRRLGLHILHRFPEIYMDLAASELQHRENLDDIEVHHEFFLLLQQRFAHLAAADQAALVAAIMQGPPAEETLALADWAAKQYGEDAARYIERYSAHWIRDRLWMVREHLDGEPREMLAHLIDRYHAPEHPAFTSWLSSNLVQDVSPIGEDELSDLTPDQLADYVRSWRPGQETEMAAEHHSYATLARAVADVILSAPQRYAACLLPVASHRPEFAHAIITRLLDPGAIGADQWDLWIGLFEGLLSDDQIRRDLTYGYEAGWPSVRLSVAWALQAGLTRASHALPSHLLRRVGDILLMVMDDPDPAPEHDRPAEGWFGHDDPSTVALNSVRPVALATFVHYCRVLAQGANTGDEKPRERDNRALRADAREALTRKLDTNQDPSRAVHSVYGSYLPVLYWLDSEWVKSSIDSIFPEAQDAESISFFVAALDAFVSTNRFCPQLLDILRPKYERAIRILEAGHVARSHIDAMGHLAVHLMWEYLLSDPPLYPAGEGNSLIAMFYEVAPSEAHESAAWACWRILVDDQTDEQTHWPKVRSLMDWRIREASLGGHSSDFDDEMEHLAQLLPVVPETESIRSLWPLLEGLLPHVTRSVHHRLGWEALAQYLRKEVDRDPVRSIQLYRLMCDHRTELPQWWRHSDAEWALVERAAAQRASRSDALALVDSLARRGDYAFRDIYDRYA